MAAAEPILRVESLYVDIPVALGMFDAVQGIDLTVGRGETPAIAALR